MKYELTIILAGETTAAKKKTVVERVTQLIEVNKGTVEKTDDWGKKSLAYPIEKNDSGVFVLFFVELAPTAAKAINEKLRLDDDVIRYLLVKAD